MHIRQYGNHLVMISLLIGTMLMMAFPVQSQEENPGQTILVIGKSPKTETNLARSREAAIADALNTAVASRALKIVPPDLVANRFDAVAALIDQQAETFVRTFKVLAEKPTDLGYRVLIQAVVSESQLKTAIDRAGLLTQKVPMPTLLFLIAEQNVGENALRFWWHADGSSDGLITESILARELKAKGYVIADRTAIIVKKDYPVDLNAVTAADIGRQYQAKVVITGKAVAITAKDTRVTDLKTYQGTLTVRAYRTDTGAQIGISHADTVTVNTDDTTGGKSVLSMLAKGVAEDLAPQLAFHQQRPDEANPIPITIEVYGTDHLRDFVTLRKALNTMPNVSRMQVKALTPPTALLVVYYKGPLKQLASDLKKTTADTLKLLINEMPVDRLKVTLSP